MVYDIFTSLPHRRVVTKHGGEEEIFDLYQCGVFDQENVELVALQAQAKYKAHYHQQSAAVIYIIFGSGKMRLAKKYIDYHAGMRMIIPANTIHGFITNTCTLFLSIQSPPIINDRTGEIDLHYESTDYV